MHRRSFLRGAAAATTIGTAGCLGLGDSNPDVALPEPDREYTSEELPYPAWGQQVPDVALPDPIGGGEVSTRSVETPAVYTFFYSHCNTVCPVLIQSMRNVQTHSIEEEYADEVAFFPVTFDPERDDADRGRDLIREEYQDCLEVPGGEPLLFTSFSELTTNFSQDFQTYTAWGDFLTEHGEVGGFVDVDRLIDERFIPLDSMAF